MIESCRGVNINISINYRENEEPLGEMHMKGYVDIANQENTDPFCFQSLSLD